LLIGVFIGNSYLHARELSAGLGEKKGFDEDLVHAVFLHFSHFSSRNTDNILTYHLGQQAEVAAARSHVKYKQQIKAKW